MKCCFQHQKSLLSQDRTHAKTTKTNQQRTLREMLKITFLSTRQVIQIHDLTLEVHGGGMPGIRDRNLLESAVSAPKASFGGEFLHKDIFAMAAAYFLSLAKNHAFIDGNKRTAVSTTATFLQLNGIGLETDEDELVDFAVRVASEKISNEEIVAFLKEHAFEAEVESE